MPSINLSLVEWCHSLCRRSNHSVFYQVKRNIHGNRAINWPSKPSSEAQRSRKSFHVVAEPESVLVVHGDRSMIDIFSGAMIDQGIGLPFPYSSLEDKYCTRILELLPGTGHQDLSCNILPLNLKDPSHDPYHAVSYMWNDENVEADNDEANTRIRAEELLCQNGTSLKISKNLNDFLRRVRHPELPTPLWIDQISINQADDAEKAQQVGIMQHVYRQAHQTILWIGEEDRHTSMGFQFAEKLFKATWNTPHGEAASPTAIRDPAFAELTGLPLCPSSEWEALAMLFKREVFQRVWVIQEVALARRVEMMCGSYSIDFSRFSAVARVIGDKGWFRILISEYGQDCRSWFPGNLFNRRLLVHSGKEQSLQLLLASTRRFQATRPVDRIYGLIGLSQVNRRKIGDLSQAPALIPDYAKPVDEVYTDVTFHVITSEGSLDILSTIEDRSKTSQNLPTWVPDYSVWQNMTILGMPLGIAYRATGRSQVSVRRDNNTLHIEARKLDRVSAISRTWDSDTEHHIIFREWCHFLMHQLDLAGHADINSNVKAIARSLIGNFAVMNSQYPAPADEYRAHFAACFQQLFNVSIPGIQLANADSALYMEAFSYICFNRRVFVSETGRIGLAHPSVQVGDDVYLFSGGRVPFVLRRLSEQKQTFELCGECYLDGVMDGEALESLDTEWSWIEII